MNCNNSTPNYGFNTCDPCCAIDGIDRELNRIEKEISCKLEGKAGKCELEKLALACECHLCGKPVVCGDDSCCTCDCYTKDEVDRLLSEKANKEPMQFYEFPLADGFAPSYGYGCIYGKNDAEIVFLHINAYTEDDIPSYQKIHIGKVPEGFRPAATLEIIGFVRNGSNSYTCIPCFFGVTQDGEVYVYTSQLPDNAKQLSLFGVYLATH